MDGSTLAMAVGLSLKWAGPSAVTMGIRLLSRAALAEVAPPNGHAFLFPSLFSFSLLFSLSQLINFVFVVFHCSNIWRKVFGFFSPHFVLSFHLTVENGLEKLDV